MLTCQLENTHNRSCHMVSSSKVCLTLWLQDGSPANPQALDPDNTGQIHKELLTQIFTEEGEAFSEVSLKQHEHTTVRLGLVHCWIICTWIEHSFMNKFVMSERHVFLRRRCRSSSMLPWTLSPSPFTSGLLEELLNHSTILSLITSREFVHFLGVDDNF